MILQSRGHDVMGQIKYFVSPLALDRWEHGNLVTYCKGLAPINSHNLLNLWPLGKLKTSITMAMVSPIDLNDPSMRWSSEMLQIKYIIALLAEDPGDQNRQGDNLLRQAPTFKGKGPFDDITNMRGGNI